MPPPDVKIGLAPPGRHAPALQMVFGHVREPDRSGIVDQLLFGARTDGSDLTGLIEARRQGNLIGAVWAQVQEGAVAVLWPPRITETEDVPESLAGCLIDAAIEFLQRHQVSMIQCLLESNKDNLTELLRAAGFTPLANLLYLISTSDSFPKNHPASSLEFATFSEDEQERMSRLIERTYERTLDCPGLNGVRRIEDVLAGYRATGIFDPSRWLFVRHDHCDMGCLLLTNHAGAEHWELVYMGLVPEARGRGWGLEVTRFAQWLARRAGRSRLVLAVDALNAPALQMYSAAGFVSWDQKTVFLRTF